ncbi:Phosphomannomutase 1 [Manis pentadactyla]|nr:Phosphomannomutase 1 [Manis pentadactyla]
MSHCCVSAFLLKELISKSLIVLETWERKKEEKFCIAKTEGQYRVRRQKVSTSVNLVLERLFWYGFEVRRE